MTVDRAIDILRRAYKLKRNFDHAVFNRMKQRYPRELSLAIETAWWGD